MPIVRHSMMQDAEQPMDRIDAMKVFVAALDEGSLAGAARKLGRSPAAVSRAVAFLEDHVGMQLLHRTTRSSRLSEAGERYAHLPVSSMIAVRVGDVRRVIAAAPSYLANHPCIDEPDDLAKQQIIAFSQFGVDSWSFPPVDGSAIPRTVQFTPRLVVNTVRAAVASAIAGRGVTRLFSYQVAEQVRAGRLRILLRSDEPAPL